jgi:exodeoxyribonuclease V beta subunit
VHKSKGLEYEHVVVLDRLNKASADKSPIIYEYDGIHLENIYLRMSKRASLDEGYNLALEKEKKLSKEDELNALYVAFTRAQESLFIIQKQKDSKFEDLELEEATYGSLELKTKVLKEVVQYEKMDFQDKYYGTQDDLLALAESDELDHKAIQFGLALHYTLEMMGSFSLQAIDEALNVSKNRFGALLEENEFSDIKTRITHLVNSSDFQDLCAGTIYKEKAVSYEQKLRYVDLLIEKEEEWIVVDYKSAMTHTSSHLKQVNFYKKAVAEITGKFVKGYIAYLLEDEVKLVEV